MNENSGDKITEKTLNSIEESYCTIFGSYLEDFSEREDGLHRGEISLDSPEPLNYVLEKKGDRWGALGYRCIDSEEGDYAVVTAIGKGDKIEDLKLRYLEVGDTVLAPYGKDYGFEDFIGYDLPKLAVFSPNITSFPDIEVMEVRESGITPDSESLNEFMRDLVEEESKRSVSKEDLREFSRIDNNIAKLEEKAEELYGFESF